MAEINWDGKYKDGNELPPFASRCRFKPSRP